VSCGNHHDTNCGEVLANLYLFIDRELDDASRSEIQHHLDECAPCLHHHELDLLVRQLVARSCTEPAPQLLRERVLLSIREVVSVSDPTGRKAEPRVTETRYQGPLGGTGGVGPF